MNIIFYRRKKGHKASVQLSSWWHYTIAGLLLASVAVVVVVAGYLLGVTWGHAPIIKLWEEDLAYQYRQLEIIENHHTAEIDSLSHKIGLLEGQVTQLSALGNKLVVLAKIKDSEFNFKKKTVPTGGRNPQKNAAKNDKEHFNIEDLKKDLSHLQQVIRERENQLVLLDNLYTRLDVELATIPMGRPVKNGWISSYYGTRKDPFTGRRQFHHGMDFATKKNSSIYAVAGGIVTHAGVKAGFGKMVEVDHRNGYTTRYAHCTKVIVKKGDAIKRGDVVAVVGSTGRSTGPHVHFEILRGSSINPLKYVKKATPKD